MAHKIEANDNMFSVLETPWHGLGEILDSPPTITEAISAASLGWTVSLQRLQTAAAVEVPAFAIFRDDTSDCLGIVGERYEPLQNQEAFDIFQPLLDNGDLSLETGGSLKNGRRVWVLAKINVDSADVGRGDEIKPFVLLSNAHDGKQAVRFGFTPTRVVCWNTLSAAEKGKQSQLIKIPHLRNVRENVLELTNIIDLCKAQFETSIANFKLLARKGIDSADLRRYVRVALRPALKKLVEDSELEVKESDLKSSEKKVVHLFESGRGIEVAKKKTMWRAYNAVNEFLGYERGSGTQDARLHSMWFAEGRRINDHALEVALTMAKAA